MDYLRNCYGLLGLSPDASADEAKRAFRAAVSACHPDQFAYDPVRRRNAEERLRSIIEAYHLIDAHLKRRPGASVAAEEGRPGGSLHEGRKSVFRHALSVLTPLNGLLTLLCVSSTFWAIHLHGATVSAALAILEVVLVPILFGVAHNLVVPSSRVVRTLYGVFTLCFLLVVAVDVVTMRDNSNLLPSSSTSPYDGLPILPAAAPIPRHTPPRESDGGETGGASLYRQGVRPPLSPHAPDIPLAPAAPMAPVVPPAR